MPAPRGGRRLRSETTAAGICPAISGATPVLSVLRAPGWILMSLLNLTQSSKLKVKGVLLLGFGEKKKQRLFWRLCRNLPCS